MSEVDKVAGLAGQLLVATPALTDPTFARTVVLLIDHDETGTLGVVINRRTPVEVADVLPTWDPFTAAPGVLFQGGPVALDSALGLAAVRAEHDGEPLGLRRMTDGLGLVDLDTAPEDVAAEMHALRIFAGYAGWGAGQLESELDEGAWYVVSARCEDPFSDDPDQLWRTVLRRQGGELAFVSTYPEDPMMN